MNLKLFLSLLFLLVTCCRWFVGIDMILVNHNWLYLLVLGEPTILLGVIFISLISPGFFLASPPLQIKSAFLLSLLLCFCVGGAFISLVPMIPSFPPPPPTLPTLLSYYPFNFWFHKNLMQFIFFNFSISFTFYFFFFF